MSDQEHHFISGINCNARGCDDELLTVDVMEDAPQMINRWGASRTEFYSVAQRSGWERWVGLRGTRDYCPEHEPKPGHKMRRVW